MTIYLPHLGRSGLGGKTLEPPERTSKEDADAVKAAVLRRRGLRVLDAIARCAHLDSITSREAENRRVEVRPTCGLLDGICEVGGRVVGLGALNTKMLGGRGGGVALAV